MSLLSNLSIKMKLFLLFILPALALVYQVTIRVLDKYHTIDEDKKTEIMVHLAIDAANFVHESQKERGATAGFLGSQGKKFQKRLPA